jgi:phytoene dehydrogenase-like protein
MKPSLGAFYVFLGLKRDLKNHGMGAFNIWDHYTFDMEEIFKHALKGKMSSQLSLVSSFNSLKDTSGSLAPEGCSTLEILSFVPYEPFSRWDGLRSNKRGQEYQDLKESIGEKMMNTFTKNHPDVVGDIDVKNYATPVSNSFWVNAVKGGAYGPAMSISQTMGGRFTPKTCFKNLFLAGSGVFGAGVPACFMSGMTAARMAENS